MLFEVVDESSNFAPSTDMVGTGVGIVFLAKLLHMLWLLIQNLCIMLLMCEEVSKLQLKCVWVIKGLDVSRALQVEPQDRVHNALVCENAVFKRFLQQTVDVVLFQGFALVGPLRGRLVEKVHP